MRAWSSWADQEGTEGTGGARCGGEWQCTTPSPSAAVGAAAAGATVTGVGDLVHGSVQVRGGGASTGMGVVAGGSPRDGGTANDGDSRGCAGRERDCKTRKGKKRARPRSLRQRPWTKSKTQAHRRCRAHRRAARPTYGGTDGACDASAPTLYTRQQRWSRPKMRQHGGTPLPPIRKKAGGGVAKETGAATPSAPTQATPQSRKTKRYVQGRRGPTSGRQRRPPGGRCGEPASARRRGGPSDGQRLAGGAVRTPRPPPRPQWGGGGGPCAGRPARPPACPA